ncbi:MAG: hypothetical protein ACREL7_03900 [Longimicrobiales bacterium]
MEEFNQKTLTFLKRQAVEVDVAIGVFSMRPNKRMQRIGQKQAGR